MRRTTIAGLTLTLLLGACQSDGSTDVVTSGAPEPTVVTGLQSFCNDLDAFAGQLQSDIAGQSDAVAAAQKTATSAVAKLQADVEGVEQTDAREASAVLDAIGGLADWKPDDASSFDDLISGAGQTVDAFRAAHC
jgi:hypothetical protein